MTALRIPDPAERNDLGVFIARVVRLDRAAAVRLVAGDGRVTAWAETPFDTLVTRSVHGTLDPIDVTVPASALLTALAVEQAETVDPGAAAPWSAELPPITGWTVLDHVPAAELARLAERGLSLAREHSGPHGPPAALLDQVVLTVTATDSRDAPVVKVPLRCLFALSGMGFLDTDGEVRVSASGSWMRLDALYGAVVRRQVIRLPLLTTP